MISFEVARGLLGTMNYGDSCLAHVQARIELYTLGYETDV
jgi:hypothetical protein